MKKKVRKPLVKPLTPDQRRGLEDVDDLLKSLIRQNRALHARVDRVARAVTRLGEPEIDRLLKGLRKRIQTARPVKKTVIPRRPLRAA